MFESMKPFRTPLCSNEPLGFWLSSISSPQNSTCPPSMSLQPDTSFHLFFLHLFYLLLLVSCFCLFSTRGDSNNKKEGTEPYRTFCNPMVLCEIIFIIKHCKQERQMFYFMKEKGFDLKRTQHCKSAIVQ